MVWVAIDDNVDVEDWFARVPRRHPQVELRGTFGPWDLVERYDWGDAGSERGIYSAKSPSQSGINSTFRKM
jgi:hypothetical protein